MPGRFASWRWGDLGVLPSPGVYSALAVFVLFLHVLFILWMAFGAFVPRSRPILRWLHIASLLWGLFTELLPWPCPLTPVQKEAKAGFQPYQGGFLLHCLENFVYPDISATALTFAGVLVCVLHLALYGRQMWVARLRSRRE